MSQEIYIQLERVNNWGNYIYIIARREYYDSVIFDEEQVDEKKSKLSNYNSSRHWSSMDGWSVKKFQSDVRKYIK